MAGNIEATCDSQYDVQCMNKNVIQDPMATLRCPSMTSKSYQSDIKSHQDKGKGEGEVSKRKQSEESAPISVVLALMAPTKCQRRPGKN